jgi:MOSC domain-containing protein YiiM
MPKQPGQALRDAWIAGVDKHHPGTPPAGYTAPWEETPEWERKCAAAVEFKAMLSIATFRDEVGLLTDEERGQFIAGCWIGEILAHVPDPKAGYLTPWEDLPRWQQLTDIDIFHALEDLAINRHEDETPDYFGESAS